MPLSKGQSRDRGTPCLSDEDQDVLDQAFESALDLLESGQAVSPQELVPNRPDLTEHLEGILTLAREVALIGQSSSAAPCVPGYTVLSELGRGAMGAVYLASQDRLGGRPVALKVLPSGMATWGRARDRFQAEANAVARLRHPHIVTVHDVIYEGSLLAFAMEPIDGPSLQELITHLASIGRPLTDQDVREYLGAGASAVGDAPYWTVIARLGVAIARALEVVHAEGLLHRDVKPSNILLRRDGTPLLGDFGLVRDPSSEIATLDGTFVGTPAYASPEQLVGVREGAKNGTVSIDRRSDVYSLGATLYHALALRTPFSGCARVDLPRMIEQGPKPLRSVCPGAPTDLCTIIAKAMAASPADRYASAAAIADDLERLLAERPIHARPAGFLVRTVKLLRRNRQAFWGTIGGAVGMLLLVSAMIMGFVVLPQWSHEARERAWLTLLDPRDANLFANAGFWEQADTGPPTVNRSVASRAISEYNAAVRWQPWDERTELERDVLATMLSMGENSQSSPQFSQALRRRAPLACAWLTQWMQIEAHELAPPVPESGCTENDLIAIGLMSYLTADMHPAVAAWLRLESLGEPGPFVRAGLGLYFIYRQEPARAYPRLEEADRTFAQVGFLRAAHAEAACEVGDTQLAAQLLEQARGLPLCDGGQLLRVSTLIQLASGDVDHGMERFKDWYFSPPYGANSIAGYQVGTWLAAHGDEARAAGVFATAVGLHPPKGLIRTFVPLAERWWINQSTPQRLNLVEAAIANRCQHVPWGETHIPLAYSRISHQILTDPELSELKPLLHTPDLAACGERLSAFDAGPSPTQSQPSAPPRGDELRQAAMMVLGTESSSRR